MGISANETITSPDGVECAVLNTSKLDFTNASLGRKTAKTLVIEAQGGEVIQTLNGAGQAEGSEPYIAKKGDAIFVNLFDETNKYVPAGQDGKRWKVSELESRGYFLSTEQNDPRGTLIESGESFRVLHEVVEHPVCIKDAWGPNQHGFFLKGATLKLNNNGSVSGIDKAAFDNTWTIVQP